MENLPTNSRAIPRVGIIGCGNIGSKFDEQSDLTYALSHAGAYHLLNIPIIAIADPDKNRLKEAGAVRKVNHLYLNGITLIEHEKIDILSICTPTNIRYPLIKKAVEQKVSVIICEKPLANSVEEGLRIKELIDNSGSQLIVNYSRRWDTTIQLIRNQISSGTVGQIQHVSATYGKGLLNNGSHLINLFQFFFGNQYSTQYVRLLQDDLIGKGPTIHCLLHCKSLFGDFPIFMKASDHRLYSIFEMDIVGTKKRIQITNSGFNITIQKIINHPTFSGYKTLALEEQSDGNYHFTMSNMIKEAIDLYDKKQLKTVSSATDALETIQIIDSIYQSLVTVKK